MRILVISLSGIGDTIITTPFFHELRANFPEAQIDAFVLYAASKGVLEGNPHLNAVHQYDLVGNGPFRSLPFLLKLRRNHYDVSINTHTQGRIHYRLIAGLIGARLRLSHTYPNFGPLDRWLIHRSVPEDYAIHTVENNNRLLSLLDKKPVLASHDIELFLTQTDQRWAQEYLHSNNLVGRPFLGVHVGSGRTKNLALKRWPLEHYIELLRLWTRLHPQWPVLLFGGREEEEDHARILREIPSPALKTPTTPTFKHAAALIGQAQAFLSVDTSLMHVAAAMKVPHQIVIEAPTLNPTNFPWRNPYQLVPNPVAHGRNLEFYRYDGKPIQGTHEELVRCMASVKVDDVYQTLRQALKL